jgi:hypothetical protein
MPWLPICTHHSPNEGGGQSGERATTTSEEKGVLLRTYSTYIVLGNVVPLKGPRSFTTLPTLLQPSAFSHTVSHRHHQAPTIALVSVGALVLVLHGNNNHSVFPWCQKSPFSVNHSRISQPNARFPFKSAS